MESSSPKEIDASNVILMHTSSDKNVPFKFTCIPANLGSANCKVDGNNLNDREFVSNNFDKVKDCIFHCPYDPKKIIKVKGQREKTDENGNIVYDDNGNTVFEEAEVDGDYNLSTDFFEIAPKTNWSSLSATEVPLRGTHKSKSIPMLNRMMATRRNATDSDKNRQNIFNLINNNKPFDYSSNGENTKCYPINLGSDKCVSDNPIATNKSSIRIVNPVGCQAYCNSNFSHDMDKTKGFIVEQKCSNGESSCDSSLLTWVKK